MFLQYFLSKTLTGFLLSFSHLITFFATHILDCSTTTTRKNTFTCITLDDGDDNSRVELDFCFGEVLLVSFYY